jgi:hypothetical protein
MVRAVRFGRDWKGRRVVHRTLVDRYLTPKDEWIMCRGRERRTTAGNIGEVVGRAACCGVVQVRSSGARTRRTHRAVGEGRGDAWWLQEIAARRRRRPFSRVHEIGRFRMGNVVVGRLRASVGTNKSRVATAYQQSGLLQSTLALARQRMH